MVPEGRGVIVVNEQRMVLGRIPPARLGDAGDRLAEAVMDVGPTTVRAHEPLDPLLERMARRNVNEIVVTTPDGELLGVVWRSTGRRAIPSLALRLGGETPSWLWHPRTRRRHCLHEVTVENWGVDGDLPASEIDVGFEIDI